MSKMKTDVETMYIDSWTDINWKNVNCVVKKLRRRIFDAKRNNNLRKLRSLQLLMLNSSANILFAIRKISYNSGSSSPGIDGLTLKSPDDRLRMFHSIFENKWNGMDPKPIRRIYIKEAEKIRPIGIPTVYDRVIQQMVCNALEPEWEAIFEKGSYGFRPKRNVDDAISRVWLSLNKEGSRKWILDSDISKCFDTISHKYLLKKLGRFPGTSLIKKMLEAGIIVREVWLSSNEGTPQGSAISPLLCNIALHGLEKELGVIYTKKGYVSQSGRTLIRFADDLVLICYTEEDAKLGKSQLDTSLQTRGLNSSEHKTKIVHISEGFDFLGYTIRMCPKKHCSYANSIIKLENNNYKIVYKNVGIYVAPSRKSIKKCKYKLKQVMVSTRGSTAKKFIEKTNSIIRGYTNAKLHWHSNKAFRELDNYVYRLSWRWALRKHPKKSYGWIKDRYFIHLKLGPINNKWVFSAFKVQPDNPVIHKNIYMLKFYWTKIRDYLVGLMDKLPDNRNDAKYFEEKSFSRIINRRVNIFGRLDGDLIYSQNNKCPICDDELFNGEKLHRHHIKPTSQGGKSNFGNLVLLHMACHYKIHNKDQFDSQILYLINYRKMHPRPNYKKLREESLNIPDPLI